MEKAAEGTAKCRQHLDSSLQPAANGEESSSKTGLTRLAFNGPTNPRRPRTLEVQNFSFKVRCRRGVCRVPIQKPSIKRRHQQHTHRADDTKVANLSLRRCKSKFHRIGLGSCCQETVLAPTSTWKYVVTGACSAPPKDATQIPSIGTLAE